MKSMVLSFLLLAFPAAAQSPAEVVSIGSRTLTRDEFVALAVRNESRFEEILIEGLALKYQQAIRLPANEWTLSIREDLELYTQRGEDDAAASAGISKLFNRTGTEISASYGITPVANSGRRTSEFSAAVTQPIARNAFGRSTRMLSRIVGLETEVARHQIIEAYEDFFAAIINSYLDWFEAYENLRVAKSSYRENLKLLENINARRQSRIAKRIDVNKINIQVLGKKEALVDFEEKYASALNLIKRAIRYEGSAELAPARPPEVAFVHESFDAVKDEFKENSRTYKILRKLEKQASLEAEREADNLFPSLDLLVSFKRSGERGDLRDREDFVGAGLSLEWPIEFRRPEHEAAKIEEKRARLKTTSTHYRLSADVKNLELAIMREKALGEIAAEKITLAETILKDESEDYTYARSSLNDYIDAVNRLDNNRFNQIRREALYRRLNIEWLRITDRLISEKLVSDHQKDGLGWPKTPRISER